MSFWAIWRCLEFGYVRNFTYGIYDKCMVRSREVLLNSLDDNATLVNDRGFEGSRFGIASGLICWCSFMTKCFTGWLRLGMWWVSRWALARWKWYSIRSKHERRNAHAETKWGVWRHNPYARSVDMKRFEKPTLVTRPYLPPIGLFYYGIPIVSQRWELFFLIIPSNR